MSRKPDTQCVNEGIGRGARLDGKLQAFRLDYTRSAASRLVDVR